MGVIPCCFILFRPRRRAYIIPPSVLLLITSTHVEAMKNRTEGEMIEAQRRGLKRMKQQGITPTHQVLDNKISQIYKDEIRESGMSYQLVPPDDHRRNIAERAIQTRKNNFSESSVEQLPHFHYTYGAKLSHRQNANSCFSQCQMSTRKSPPTTTFMVNMTTTPSHLYLSAWSL